MRFIPPSLLAKKQQTSTTLCNLIKIKSKNGQVVGMTNLNTNIEYDDGKGDGLITYYAPVGTQPASIYSSSNMEVDNSEFQALVPEFDFDLNEFSINAGEWDYSDFWFYEVDYTDLSLGHWVVMHGTLGEVRTVDGITIWGEMRSLTDQLKKPIVELYSLGCRAKFGDSRCGYDTETLWITGVVESLGSEPNRTFFDSSKFESSGHFEPGLVQFLTGKNAGRYVEVETFLSDSAGGEINLNFPTPYDIEVGDTYRIRRDCNKQARDEAKGCKHWWGAEWPLHFRGEPDIPVGEAGQASVPGASTGPGSGGRTGFYGQVIDAIENEGED